MKIIARQAGGNGAFKVNLDHYRSDEGASEFTRLLSGAFSSHKQQGCVAFLSVDAEDARLISLSAWHAGWKVMLLPESLEADKLIAIGKDVDILVCRKPGQQQSLQKLAPVVLCLEDDDEDGDTLLSWLTNQTNFAEGSGHSWSESEPALVLFTSGSTGLPKGVCHSISNIVASAKRFIEHFDLGDNDILFNTAPLHMISGFRGSVLLPFFSKLSVTTLDGEANPDNIIRILQRDRPTTMITGPNIVRQLSMLTAKLSDHTRSLRAIFSTGAKLDRDCRTKIYRDLNIPVLDYYGTTETGGCVIGEFADDYRPQSMAMGKSCVNVRLRLIDGNKSRKFGEGELRIYTDSIFLGYGGSELKPNEFYDTGDHVSISKKGDVTWPHRAICKKYFEIPAAQAGR